MLGSLSGGVLVQPLPQHLILGASGLEAEVHDEFLLELGLEEQLEQTDLELQDKRDEVEELNSLLEAAGADAPKGGRTLLLCEPVTPPPGYVPTVHGKSAVPRELEKCALEATRIVPALAMCSWRHGRGSSMRTSSRSARGRQPRC